MPRKRSHGECDRSGNLKNDMRQHSTNRSGRKGKYLLAVDGYVYDLNGKMIVWLGNDAYDQYKLWGAKRFDAFVENEIKKK